MYKKFVIKYFIVVVVKNWNNTVGDLFSSAMS
jgi:hypothetical protein